MDFAKRLPQNLKETIIFMAVVSIISVNLIAPLITGLEVGFSISHWVMVLHQLPLLWVSVIILVVLTQQPAAKMANYFLGQQPNFRAAMLVTAMCNVFLMSLVLTILGTWIGTGHVTLDPIVHFASKWPRNYTLALIVEAFIAQPIARSVMAWLHRDVTVTAED